MCFNYTNLYILLSLTTPKVHLFSKVKTFTYRFKWQWHYFAFVNNPFDSLCQFPVLRVRFSLSTFAMTHTRKLCALCCFGVEINFSMKMPVSMPTHSCCPQLKPFRCVALEVINRDVQPNKISRRSNQRKLHSKTLQKKEKLKSEKNYSSYNCSFSVPRVAVCAAMTKP